MSDTESKRLGVPLLALRDTVVFPGSVATLTLGRTASIEAVRAALEGDRLLAVVAQCRDESESPQIDDLHDVGTLVRVEHVVQGDGERARLTIHGVARIRVDAVHPGGRYAAVDVEEVEDQRDDSSGEIEAVRRALYGAIERFAKLSPHAPPDLVLSARAISHPGRFAFSIADTLKLKAKERQDLLDESDVSARLRQVHRALLHELEFLRVQRKLRARLQRERDNDERRQRLDEQVRAMRKDLSARDEREDLAEIARQLERRTLAPAASQKLDRELKRLGQMNPMSAEATIVRNYIEWIIALPWDEVVREPVDLAAAADILEADHFGLSRVKERILEYLAVARLTRAAHGPVLCLVGPPGVGKTSFARSMARATSRPFGRIALGGVRDEAEIRGHRRTYIGAMPGRLIQAMKRVESPDPVLLLDEIDKMASDMRGDPASALLEVLDPEQNRAFRDHYLDIDYDLSRVMFVCTANSLRGIPVPLRDRLEIIELSGYTEREKIEIARRYLLPKQRRLAGLEEVGLDLREPTLRRIVREYTRESGVRGLERQLASVCRKVARRIVDGADAPSVDSPERPLDDLLGPPRFEIGRRECDDHVGLVKGLSVSSVGGAMLDIEVSAVPGRGEVLLTGRLGETLKESASAALTYLRSRADALGLDRDFYKQHDFHVHYPGIAGGVDGPSAGIGMATALVSELTGLPVRSDTAMTGEITLRGRVLRVGGVKEKILAAHRGGITRVLLPEGNGRDLVDVPEHVLDELDVVLVGHMDRVLAEALAGTVPDTRVEDFGVSDPSTPALPHDTGHFP